VSALSPHSVLCASRHPIALVWLGLAGCLLSGCAQRQHVDSPPPPPRIITVSRVVAEACLRPADVPPPPAGIGARLNGDAVHDTEVLAAALLAAEAWQGKAVALLGACTAPTPAG